MCPAPCQCWKIDSFVGWCIKLTFNYLVSYGANILQRYLKIQFWFHEVRCLDPCDYKIELLGASMFRYDFILISSTDGWIHLSECQSYILSVAAQCQCVHDSQSTWYKYADIGNKYWNIKFKYNYQRTLLFSPKVVLFF